VRAVAEPAAALTLPPSPAEPSDLGRIGALAAKHGLEFLGPPGIPAA
jgi:hypothetical protein